MSPVDILVLTALVVVILVALMLLVSGIGLLTRAFSDSDLDHHAPRQRPWQVERLVYRHHRITGTLITLGSTYFLWQSFQEPISGLADSPWAMFWWTLAAAHACTLLVGLVILLRPSRLKPIESLANRHYDLGLSTPGYTATRRPAVHGLLIAGIAAVVLVGMSLLLFERLGWMA